MHPDANTLNATSYGLTLEPLMDAARSLLFGAQGTGGGDSGEDEEQGAWPSMEYTSYRDFSNPVLRSLDLIQGLKVQNK